MKKMFKYLLYVIVAIVLVIVLFFSAVFVTNKVLVSVSQTIWSTSKGCGP